MCDRKRIVELIELYRLEPSLKDIYVEGVTDREIIAWYLRRRGRRDISIYPIDTVDVPKEVTARYSLPPDCNRSRVVALSYEFAKVPGIKATVMCVADRDYEDYAPTLNHNPFLVLTDFCAVENYFWDAYAIDKFLSVCLCRDPGTHRASARGC